MLRKALTTVTLPHPLQPKKTVEKYAQQQYAFLLDANFEDDAHYQTCESVCRQFRLVDRADKLDFYALPAEQRTIDEMKRLNRQAALAAGKKQCDSCIILVTLLTYQKQQKQYNSQQLRPL